MKRILWLALLLLGLYPTTARAESDHLPDTLSPQAELSLLTCDPGTELYSIFGHSSIRVHDPVQRIDWVFNYGTFDFSTPNFGLKFAQGKLEYYLLSYSMRAFMQEYEEDLRGVREHVLNLSHPQKVAIYRSLKENELPENRYYLYDFFYDNCASRERDILRDALGDNIQFKAPPGKEYGSYRSLITPYLEPWPWTGFGINLLLGIPADKVAGVEGAVFLPDHLHDIVGASQVRHNGDWKPLVTKSLTLYEAPKKAVEGGGIFSPWIVMWALAAFSALITFSSIGRRRIFHLFDTLLFGLVGLLGILMLVFWLGTDHDATYRNLNVIWALPTHLFLAVAVWIRRWHGVVRSYATVTLVISVLFLVTNWFLPQHFHPAIYPIVVAMALRLGMYRMRLPD